MRLCLAKGGQADVDAEPVDSEKCGAEAPRGLKPAPHDLGFLLLVTAPAVTAGGAQ